MQCYQSSSNALLTTKKTKNMSRGKKNAALTESGKLASARGELSGHWTILRTTVLPALENTVRFELQKNRTQVPGGTTVFLLFQILGLSMTDQKGGQVQGRGQRAYGACVGETAGEAFLRGPLLSLWS